MRSLLAVLALVVLTAGCGPKRSPKPAVDKDVPSWRTEDGRKELRYQLLEQFIGSRNASEALVLIAQLRESGEDTPELDLYQGQALLYQGLHTEAEVILLEYAAKRPRDPRPHQALGVLYAETQRPELAIASLREAVRLDDHDAATWNNLGFLLMSHGDAEQALEALRTAVALDGTVPRYRNNLGFTFARLGRYSDALSAFESGGPPDEAHYNLGVAYELQGETDNALTHYRKALEYNPRHGVATDAVERLKASEEDL